MNIQQMKYNITIKENAIMKSVGKWMDLENILRDKDMSHNFFSPVVPRSKFSENIE